MTTENWIALAAVIVAFLVGIGAAIGPILAAVVQHRLNHPEQKSVATTKQGRPPYITLALVLIGNVANVIFQGLSSEPVTRWSVVLISASVGVCFLLLAMFGLVWALDKWTGASRGRDVITTNLQPTNENEDSVD